MLPAATKSAGQNLGFPDVCLTPSPVGPIPIPYPNLAMNAQATGFSTRVRLSGANALTLSTRIPMTSGDEAGSAHPMFKQAGAYTTGNPKVFIESVPAICLLCPTTGNNMNNPVGAVLVPSVTNVFFTYASSRQPDTPPTATTPSVPELTRDDMESLASATASAGAEQSPVDVRFDPDGIAHLRIHVFSADVPSRVFCALRDPSPASLRELILDLRGCPGGDLLAAVELAGDFLPPGSLVATLIDAAGDETPLRAGTENPLSVPLTLLVDGQTASAAEIFARCLSAHGRARVEGGPTYGKTTAQLLVPGPEGAPVRVTVAHALDPLSRSDSP